MSAEAKLAKSSPLFYATLVVAIAIIVVGINFIVNPIGGGVGYGIASQSSDAIPYMWVKGIRDIFSGLVVIASLVKGDRHFIGIVLAIAIFIPVGDGLIILNRLGLAMPLLIHWGTALYMIVVATLLLRVKRGTDLPSQVASPKKD